MAAAEESFVQNAISRPSLPSSTFELPGELEEEEEERHRLQVLGRPPLNPNPTSTPASVGLPRVVPGSRNDSNSPVIPFGTDAEQLANDLGTSLERGLDESEARSRLTLHGQNVLKQQKKDTALSLLWKQVANTMTVVLLIALVIAFSIRDFPDGSVIAGIPIYIVRKS